MPHDWLGTGAKSARDFAERIIAETIRRVKLEARNDVNFVPPPDDLSVILAARQFVLPPVIPPPGANDLSVILASRVFSHDSFATAGGGSVISDDASGIIAAQVFAKRPSVAYPSPYLIAPVIANGLTMLGTASAAIVPGRVSLTGTATGAGFAAGDIGRSATNGFSITSSTGSVYDFTILTPGGNGIFAVSTGTLNVIMFGSLTLPSGGIAVTGNSTITGTLSGVTTFTVTTVTATNLGGTLSTAAQGNVTSLGTLTALVLGTGVALDVDSVGGDAVAGQCTLGVGGTVTVNTTMADTFANGRIIFFQRVTSGGTIGFATTYTVVSGTSFTLSSDNALDSSTFNWIIHRVH